MDSLYMRSHGSICRFQVEYGLVGFLREWHEATIMLEKSETVGVLGDCNLTMLLLMQYMTAIHFGNAGNPTIVRLHGTIEAQLTLDGREERHRHLSFFRRVHARRGAHVCIDHEVVLCAEKPKASRCSA